MGTCTRHWPWLITCVKKAFPCSGWEQPAGSRTRLSEQGIELLTVRVSGVRGKGISSKLVAPVKIFIAIIQALCICIRRRPAAVLGMGGFASGPGAIAAWLLRIPY